MYRMRIMSSCYFEMHCLMFKLFPHSLIVNSSLVFDAAIEFLSWAVRQSQPESQKLGL